MKILIIGGAGFIASHIADRLVELNYDVSIVDNLSAGKKENINSKTRFYKCDITNYDALRLIFNMEKPEVVIHHAAQTDVQTSILRPAFDADINIIGTINVLECCKESGVRKVIYSSSAAVYGNPEYLPIDENHKVNPISFYGISKHTPEHYIKVYSEIYNMKYTIFRYANVYGIRQDPKGEGGVISIFIDRLLNNKTPFIYGDGEQTRDFIYVKDVAKANIKAITKGDNEIVNISTNKPISINRLYEEMGKISGINIKAKYKPKRIGDILNSYLSNEKAKNVLGWEEKYTLEGGLLETIDYYKNLYE